MILMGGSAKTWVLGIALLGVGQNCRSGDFFYQNPQHPAPVFSPGVRHSIAPSLPHLDSPARIEVPARTAGEPRWLVVGRMGDKHWSAVVTYREDRIRIISVRRARDEEVRIYEV